MKKFNYIILVVAFLFVIILVQNAKAFMPLEHFSSVERALQSNNSIGTDFYTACHSYPDLCYAGSMENDVGIIWYYTSRGKYNVLHSPPFCANLLDNVAKVQGGNADRLRACAVGGCLHLSTDIVSHSNNGLVEYAIKHTFLPNEIVHVFAEQHLDNWVISNDEYSSNKYKTSLLAGYQECEPLFVQAMMGQSEFSGMSQAEIEQTFDTFVTEIVNSQTGYDVGFKDKSFFVSIKSIPLPYIAGFVAIILSILLIDVLLIFKFLRRQAKARHVIGLIVFIPILILLVYLFFGLLSGSLFNNFITVIKPISNLVPIGTPQGYMDQAIKNNQQLLSQGETWLIGKDASGRGTNPVLDTASSSVSAYSYIFMTIILIIFIWFIWFLFKKNKVVNNGLSLSL